jgi:hypothetical protein
MKYRSVWDLIFTMPRRVGGIKIGKDECLLDEHELTNQKILSAFAYVWKCPQ